MCQVSENVGPVECVSKVLNIFRLIYNLNNTRQMGKLAHGRLHCTLIVSEKGDE